MTKVVTQSGQVIKKNVTKNENKIECVWPQILAILAGAMASFTEGVLFSWISPFIVKIVQDKQNYNISETEAANLTIIQPLSLLISGLFLSKICDVVGRKKVVLFIAIPQILSLLISAFARSIYVFYTARVFSGIASALLWSSLPMYIGEVASPKVRGVWGNSLTSSIYVGQFFVNAVGSYFDVATTSYIFLSVPILFIILFTFMPESPYYYIMKNDYKSAKQSLIFLTKKSNVDEDFLKLKEDVKRQMSESGSWKELITIRSNRKALVAGLFLRLSQQFGASSIFNIYTQFIFQKSGSSISPQIASIIASGLCLVLNIFAVVFIVDKFSRKKLYTTSLALCGISLIVMSSYFYLDEMLPNVDMSSLNFLPLTTMISYQIMFSFGLGVIPTLMLGELFSTSIKAKALAILMINFGLGNFITNFIFNFLISSVGNYAPFLFFGVCAIVSAFFSLYFVPETKGKTLEEIQISLKQKKNDFK